MTLPAFVTVCAIIGTIFFVLALLTNRKAEKDWRDK